MKHERACHHRISSEPITQIYLHAVLELKEQVLGKTEPFRGDQVGVGRLTSSWPSCKLSDNAECRNEKKGDSSKTIGIPPFSCLGLDIIRCYRRGLTD